MTSNFVVVVYCMVGRTIAISIQIKNILRNSCSLDDKIIVFLFPFVRLLLLCKFDDDDGSAASGTNVSL